MPGFEWCAEHADFYRDAYLAYAANRNTVVSGGWNAWFRDEGGAWNGPVAATFPNFFGDDCLGRNSWCAEIGLGERSILIVPSDTFVCEAMDAVYGCGDGTWSVALTVGVDRLSACGF